MFYFIKPVLPAVSVSKCSSSVKGHSRDIRRKLITFPLFLSHTNVIVRSIKKRKVVAHAYNFTAYIVSVTGSNSLIELIITFFFLETLQSSSNTISYSAEHIRSNFTMYIYFLWGKNQRSEIGYLTSPSCSCTEQGSRLLVSHSFRNSSSNSRFEIQRLKHTYCIWKEQMMCAASVTFKICFISANKTLEQSRVSRVISFPPPLLPGMESWSLFQWPLDSPQSECDCENTFTFSWL